LREAEVKTIRSWMLEGGMQRGASVRRLLSLGGVSDGELDTLKIDWEASSASSCLDQLLKQPPAKAERQRHRAIVTLLLAGLAANNEERERLVSRWVREHALVGRLPETAVTFEQVFDVPDSVVPVGLDADRALIGQRIGDELQGVLRQTTPLVLRADRRAAEIPVEWARENDRTDPVCMRRQIRWMLPYTEHRLPLIDELSARALPPRCMLLALKGDHINPEGEIHQLQQELANLYRKNDWPPEFVKAVVCESRGDVEALLQGCSSEIVHIAGHMASGALQVAAEQIASDEVGQWLASSKVRLLVLNGCEGALAGSPLALYSVAIADRIVQLGRVPEVVAHRLALTEVDGVAFAVNFARAFIGTFDAAAACFEARRVGSANLKLSPVLISQRRPRLG
jgi:hypothetical protein